MASKEAVFITQLSVHCKFPAKQLFVNFTWTLSTGREPVLRPCSSRKAGVFPRNSFRCTGPNNHPLLQSDIFSEKNQGLLLSAPLYWRGMDSPRRSDGNPGKIARSTSCRKVMVSFQARGIFKPFSNSRDNLSLRSSAWIGSTDLFSKAAIRFPANVRLVPRYFH